MNLNCLLIDLNIDPTIPEELNVNSTVWNAVLARWSNVHNPEWGWTETGIEIDMRCLTLSCANLRLLNPFRVLGLMVLSRPWVCTHGYSCWTPPEFGRRIWEMNGLQMDICWCIISWYSSVRVFWPQFSRIQAMSAIKSKINQQSRRDWIWVAPHRMRGWMFECSDQQPRMGLNLNLNRDWNRHALFKLELCKSPVVEPFQGSRFVCFTVSMG